MASMNVVEPAGAAAAVSPPLKLSQPDIWSDHAEVRTGSIMNVCIAAWNVCNPTYMDYFKADDSPFRETPLAVDKSDIATSHYVRKKTHMQVSFVEQALKSGSTDVFIIPEAFKDFIDAIILNLELTSAQSEFRHVLEHNPKESGNHIMIIYNAKKFPDAMTGIRELVDEETNRPFRLAFVVFPQKGLTVIGVHVPGNAEQYPKGALTALANWLGPNPVHLTVIGGDWNTKPENALKHLPLYSTVLLPANPRPTHITPFSEVVIYDYFVALGGPRLASLDVTQTIGSSSLGFVSDLERYKRP